MIDIEQTKKSVLVIGYYVPNESPQFLGTGFLVGEGDRALTCAHVVLDSESKDEKPPVAIPREKIINGKTAELSCWTFNNDEKHFDIVRFKILEIATYMDPQFKSYYVGGSPDVAYLILEMTVWSKTVGNVMPPSLKVSNNILRDVGSEVAIIGYPSTDILMVVDKSGKPKCVDPIVQFARLAGALPFIAAPIIQYLAFDLVVAKGCSGSPVVNLATGEVVAIIAELHPFYLPTSIGDKIIARTMVPSGISFGVPSNFFLGLSLSRDGLGEFNFNENS